MTLDSWMVARLARELDAQLAGARIEELHAGERSLALECHRRGKRLRLIASFEPERPLAAVTLLERSQRDGSAENDERGSGGWAGGVAPLLRGAIIDAVQAVPHDRILNVDLASRSAFGVPARHRLVLELEPRRANALVVRSSESGAGLVLAAAKVFTGTGGTRTLEVGQSYESPPPRRKELDDEEFRTRVEAAMVNVEPRVLARLLGQWDPQCTPPLARDVVERALAAQDAGSPADLLLEYWRELRARVESAAAQPDARVHAWRRGDEIIACHLVPLVWPAGEAFTVASLNELCAEQLAAARRARSPLDLPLRRKLELMLSRGATEIESLRAAQSRAVQADSLRAQGDAIYANLARIEPGSTELVTDEGMRIALDPLLTAKQNAAEYFRSYKKARSGLPRIKTRLAELAANREQWEHLLWELDRAQNEPALRSAIIDDVTAAIGAPRRSRRLGPPSKLGRTKKVGRSNKFDRSERDAGIAFPGGAIAYVGRSPRDNERLTFSVARPNDLWFHARGIPGAHVVLRMPRAGEVPTAQQIEAAAALAAGSSRAAHAGKVEVDYTQRKHVRRRGGGRTGFVWYTDFKTVLVAPQRKTSIASPNE